MLIIAEYVFPSETWSFNKYVYIPNKEGQFVTGIIRQFISVQIRIYKTQSYFPFSNLLLYACEYCMVYNLNPSSTFFDDSLDDLKRLSLLYPNYYNLPRRWTNNIIINQKRYLFQTSKKIGVLTSLFTMASNQRDVMRSTFSSRQE